MIGRFTEIGIRVPPFALPVAGPRLVPGLHYPGDVPAGALVGAESPG